MKPTDEDTSRLLRRRAELLLELEPDRLKTSDGFDFAGLVHELTVFQTELELQNEELRQAHLRAEEARKLYVRLYELAPVGYLRLDEQGMLLHCNQTFVDMVAGTSKSMTGKPLAVSLDQDSLSVWYARYNAFFNQPDGKNLEVRFNRLDGSSFMASLTGRRDLHCISENALHPSLLITVSDISDVWQTRQDLERARAEAEGNCDVQRILLAETRRLSRLYLVLSRVNQLIVQHPDVTTLFQGVCDIAVQDGGFFAAWIGTLEAGGVIQPSASSGLGLDQLSCLGIRTCGSRGQGPCGVALRTGQTSVINDLNSASSVAPWKDFISKFGIQSVAALPICTRNRQYGCFVLYAHEQNVFDSAEVQLLEEIARNIGHALMVAELDKAQEQANVQLNFLAQHDSLTGLPNRLFFSQHLNQALEKAGRRRSQLALLLIDLDRFKDVNDSFGHQAGDDLLKQVAERISKRLRTADGISRLGGDEFTVVLDDIHEPQDAAWVANDLIELLSRPFMISGAAEVSIGASIGISLYPSHGNTEHALLQQADAALYRAKATGRGRFTFYTEELTREALRRIQLEINLRKAHEHKELCLYYQPQLDLRTNKTIGVEALLRWRHPDHGLILPDNFIVAAEETGLIKPIGEWVIREACQQGHKWVQQGMRIRLAVNISPFQLKQPTLVDMILSILDETGFPADLLELEVTESALMLHEDEAAESLERLSSAGVRLALDDFGTGYSSLARIKRFPLDILKIDRSFIADSLENQSSRAITAAIISMGHSLGFKVLAEGVETQEQLELLRSLGCDLYQGWLAARAMPAEQLAEFLADR